MGPRSDPAEALRGRAVVVGVCGSIAAYKVAIIVRLLVRAGADVHVMMTRAATRFIGPVTFRALSRRPVITDMWAPDSPWDEPHVALGRLAACVLIAPATADMLGRLASGLADDVVCATVLATRAPILLAPAMSAEMAAAPVVEENLARLRARGMHVIGPEHGELASGEVGWGRLSEPEAIVARLATLVGEPGTRR
ncbi:MAG TPA: flavoprotein [bacterium]|nr:flavoprotein [bacterium]